MNDFEQKLSLFIKELTQVQSLFVFRFSDRTLASIFVFRVPSILWCYCQSANWIILYTQQRTAAH